LESDGSCSEWGKTKIRRWLYVDDGSRGMKIMEISGDPHRNGDTLPDHWEVHLRLEMWLTHK
jgi:hypothetical protein